MFSYGLCTIHPTIQIGQQVVLKCKQVGQLYHIGVGLSPPTQVLSITTNSSSTWINHLHQCMEKWILIHYYKCNS